MDIERTMQFIVENLAAVSARLEKMAERQNEMDEHRKRTDERRSELEEEFTKRLLASEERHDEEMSAIRAELRRGIRLSVEEHRRERVRRQEMDAKFDEKITQLASAQLINEEGLKELRKALLDWLRRSGNGHQAA